MATVPVKRVKLFVGMILAADIDPAEVTRLLALEFSSIDAASDNVPFTQTSYYDKEMGPGLRRQWVSTSFLIHPAEIADIKKHCVHLEKFYARPDGSRRVNLDPGYLDLARVVLPTTKDRAHRVYLRDGIWAEATMHWDRMAEVYRPFEYTYEDYRTETAGEFFKKLREIYHAQLAENKPEPQSCR